MVRFRCTLCGVCCSRYWVPVTHLDVWRIVYYGDYEPDSFLKLYEVGVYKSRMPKVRLLEGGGYIGLRKLSNGLCFFNSKMICRVHEFKPLACRFYPFMYVTSGGKVVGVEVNKEAAKLCPGLVVDGKPMDLETFSRLMKLAEIRMVEKRLYSDMVREFNSESYGKHDLETFLDFIVEKAEADMRRLKRKGLWIK